MDANTYQREAARTLIDAPTQPLTSHEHMIVWNVIGLMGEAGKVWYLAQDLDSEGCAADPDATAILWRASQLAEHVKKAIFHEQGVDLPLVASYLERIGNAAAALWLDMPHGESTAPLQKELGDLLWYLAAICSKLGWKLADVLRLYDAQVLADVMQANIDKLRVRFPAGWSTADAAARVDVGADRTWQDRQRDSPA